MRRVLIRHQGGSKANQIDPFTFDTYRELLIGRDSSCQIAYDDDRDSTVSGQHARILRDSPESDQFVIEDMESRNGTFLDTVRIAGRAVLRSGSTVKLGRTGPSFVFEIDPPPARKATVADGSVTQAGEAWWERGMRRTIGDWTMAPVAGGSGISRASLLLGSAAVLLTLIVGLGAYLYLTSAKSAGGIVESNSKSVVALDVAWKLVDVETGRQVYHWNLKNPFAADAALAGLEKKDRVPVFVRAGDGTIEPVLILDDEKDTNRAIGGRIAGSGCVVQANGFVLTSSRIAAPWTAEYTFASEAVPALLVDLASRRAEVLRALPRGWVPSRARFVLTRRATLDALRAGEIGPSNRMLEGRLDHLNVDFGGSSHQQAGKVAGTSATHPLSIIKVDALKPLPPVRLDDAGKLLGVSDRAYVLGFSRDPQQSKTPGLRLAGVLAIGPTGGGRPCSGCYQLSDTAADAGFVGAPMFDERGHVVGVYQMQHTDGAPAHSAVPVRFALELMNSGKQ